MRLSLCQLDEDILIPQKVCIHLSVILCNHLLYLTIILQTILVKGTAQSTRGSRNTTWIYGSSAADEVMPPLYCFDSSAANEEHYQVQPEWVEGLPRVRGKYGCPTTELYESCVTVRKSGCIDEQLMH